MARRAALTPSSRAVLGPQEFGPIFFLKGLLNFPKPGSGNGDKADDGHGALWGAGWRRLVAPQSIWPLLPLTNSCVGSISLQARAELLSTSNLSQTPGPRKLSQVCRYFQRGFCSRGDQCSFQHPQPPGALEWGRRHSEPHLALPGPQLGLTRRGSEPTYLPSLGVDWGWARAWWGPKPSLEDPASKVEEVGGSSWKLLSPTSADRDHSYSQESQPKSDVAQELVALLQSLDLEEQQREQDSRDVVCGICMDKVWEKPEAERVFGILPNCPHAHCLGCLRTWRKKRQDFSKDIIKACPQCRIHSSYIIPHKFWVSKGAEKEQLIKNFKARTSQIRCRFFVRGNGYCPFKSDCIYLHQLPAKAPISGPAWPESTESSKVPRGLRAGGRCGLHRLCPGHGLLGLRAPTGSQPFLPQPPITRLTLQGMGRWG
ncbi:probable E3 ubiquitin-protein ligase makorin-1 [Choloepus didactylus]|uniref:probable E3 ubiquitin-protein ligase makorin-1 n=1 Tax=Choloepus didactylus TaxID=27675 RepID=UPI0018A025E5|nr:probable E3 ubiquitin-protein ligase makorin-1 [Choloepus didactylus]